MTENQVLNEINRFIENEIAFEEFEDWIIFNLDDAGEAVDQIRELDSLLVELQQNVITDKQFVDAMITKVRIAETIERTDLVISQESYENLSTSINETVFAPRIPTGLDREVVVPFALR